MQKSRRLRKAKRTQRMRGGNDEDMELLNDAANSQHDEQQPQSVEEEPPIVEEQQQSVEESQPVVALKEQAMTIGEKAKHATRKAVDWLKGWFGVGQQTQMGGRRRKTQKRTKTRKNRKH